MSTPTTTPEAIDAPAGELAGIYIVARKNELLQGVAEVEAVAGRGLTGDRYFLKQGAFSAKEGADRELTLIESEALEALEREFGVVLRPEEARRNLLTRGVRLNDLVGKEFAIGDVLARGLRLCEPCGHLERLTGKTLIQGLSRRGGLRAQILRGGVLRVGDRLAPAAQATS
jgi:MOSC domain-containing protein YiiM